MKAQDTIHVMLSDTHSGSNHALFLPRHWEGMHTSHHPRSEQKDIRAQFEKFAAQVAQARKSKRVRMVVNGDAIDGDHHNSGDVCTIDEVEQANIHIELMQEFQKRINWQRGDEIYYTKGTQSHTHNMENYIGEQMNAVPDGDFYCHNILKLETNGTQSIFVHHGVGAGQGANEGNALRNMLRAVYYDALKDNDRVPDVVVPGHVHNPTYSPFGYRVGMVFKNIHGIILPSWQNKTRYAWMKAPHSRNKIGGVYQEIKADGTICVPVFSVAGYE